MGKWIAGGLAALLVFLIGIVALVSNESCGSSGTIGSPVDTKNLPDSIGAWNKEQLGNAAIIIQTGQQMGLDTTAQKIAVMVAMGESSLRNINHGDDARNPDGSMNCSLGLFQQQWCLGGTWGTKPEDVLDPANAAKMFYEALTKNEAYRAGETPTYVAHKVQGNLDPHHYEPMWADAAKVVDQLTGLIKPGENVSLSPAQTASCPSGAAGAALGIAGAVNPKGWAKPSNGTLTDGFGPRNNYYTGASEMHTGQDFSAPCGDPIFAANDGIVTFQGFEEGGAGMIDIDHGGGIVTRYLHMDGPGMYVKVGDRVKGGQHIAAVGTTGYSTGCHLHFETRAHGEPVDPIPFLANVGLTF